MHVHLKNEFTEDKKYYNLMSWLKLLLFGIHCQNNKNIKNRLFGLYLLVALMSSHSLLSVHWHILCMIYQPVHNKNYKITRAPSEDSDQSVHLHTATAWMCRLV